MDEKLDNLTLRHVRLFLAAARFENFSAAARYMYMTQPMVSRIIAGIEQELGLRLFSRSGKKVQLTPAGRVLQESWEALLASAGESLKKAQEIQGSGQRHIGIGNDWNADRDLYFFPVLSRYIQQFPELEIDIAHGETAQNLEELRKGGLDFVYAMLYDAPGLDETALTWKLLARTTFVAYIPPQSGLYEKEQLLPGDLREETLLLLPERSGSGYTAAVLSCLRQLGLTEGKRIYLASMQSINYNLYQGKGIFIGNPFIKLLHREHFKALPLPGTLDGPVAVWRREDRRSEVLQLVRQASAFFEEGSNRIMG